jgi:DNA-binding transcriptional regulator YhcF (GntR family)
MAKAASGVSLAFPALNSTATPLYRSIRDTLAGHIADGALKAGIRLPSSRTLARDLGVSRNTVALAYEILFAEGLIDARVGDGTYVAGVAPVARSQAGARFPEDAWARALLEGVGHTAASARQRLQVALAAHLRTTLGLDVTAARLWPVAAPRAALEILASARTTEEADGITSLRRPAVIVRDATDGPLTAQERCADALIVDLTQALWPRATLAVVCLSSRSGTLSELAERLDVPAPAVMHATARLAEDGHLSAWLRHCHAGCPATDERRSA